jgi:hypothetical protein
LGQARPSQTCHYVAVDGGNPQQRDLRKAGEHQLGLCVALPSFHQNHHLRQLRRCERGLELGRRQRPEQHKAARARQGVSERAAQNVRMLSRDEDPDV